MTSLPARLLRIAFPALCLVSASLCMGTAWLWWRSYHAPAVDWVWWNSDEPGGQAVRSLSFRSGHGGFQIEDYRLRFKRPRHDPEHFAWLRERRGLAITHPVFCLLPEWTVGASELRDNSIGWCELDWPDLWDAPGPMQFHADRQEDRSYLNTWRGAFVPYRVPASAFAAPPLLWLALHTRRGWARRRRRLLGLCPRCGYDLTGNTSGRCSECGRLVGPTDGSAAA